MSLEHDRPTQKCLSGPHVTRRMNVTRNACTPAADSGGLEQQNAPAPPEASWSAPLVARWAAEEIKKRAVEGAPRGEKKRRDKKRLAARGGKGGGGD